MSSEALNLAVSISFLKRLALIVLLFPARQRDGKLRIAAFVDKKPRGNDCAPLGFHGAFELRELACGKQELAVAPHRMVVKSAQRILRDVEVTHPELTVDKKTIGVNKASVPLTKGLNLRPCKYHASSIGVDELVEVTSLSVLSDQFFGHSLFRAFPPQR